MIFRSIAFRGFEDIVKNISRGNDNFRDSYPQLVSSIPAYSQNRVSAFLIIFLTVFYNEHFSIILRLTQL